MSTEAWNGSDREAVDRSLGLDPLEAIESLGPSVGDPALARSEGDRIGDKAEACRFEIGREIGVGGNARVSLVRDRRLLREVAWKRGDWRLLREARVLAQLEHPGIVPIYDMGFDPDGQAFFAMRVVRGRSLSQVLRTTPAHERASLLRPLLQAAEAVAFAHHRGVVHRDLKPANIMVGRFGESQVVDWGLARVLEDGEDALPEDVRLAVGGHDLGRIGTPGYMSPEQEQGLLADRRSDVYALGRILEKIVRFSKEQGRSAETTSPELEAIIRKSVADDPEDRYPDAAAFAADLTSHLDGHRVSAHSYGQRELLRRFVKTHRVHLTIVAIGMAALVAFGIIYVVRLGQERAVAENAAEATEVALRRSDEHLARSLVGEARRQLGLGARAEAEVLAAHALSLNEDPDARGILASVSGAPSLELLTRVPLPCAESQVDPVRGLTLCTSPEGVAMWTHAGGVPRLLWSYPFMLRVASLVDGGVVLVASNNAVLLMLGLDGREVARHLVTVRSTRKFGVAAGRAVFESARRSLVVDLPRREVRQVPVCNGELHGALALSPDPTRSGAQLMGALCKDGTLRRPGRDVPTTLVAPDREGARMVVVSPTRVVVGTTKGEVIVLDSEGQIVNAGQLVNGMVRLLEPSPDGRLLVVAGEGEPIVLVTLPDLARIGSLPRRAKTATWDVTRPSDLLTTGAWLERWRVESAPSTRPLHGAYVIPLEDGVVSLDYEREGEERLAVAHGPHVAMISTTQLVSREVAFVTTKGANINGASLLAGGIGGVVRIDAESMDIERYERPMLKAFRRLVTLADGTSLLASYNEVDRIIGDEAVAMGLNPVLDLSVSPNRMFAVALSEPSRSLFRLRSGDFGFEVVGVDPRAEAVAIAADGERVFAAHRDEIAVWSTSGYLEQMLDATGATLLDVEVSGDGRWVAAGAKDGGVWLWELGNPSPRARFTDHDERVPALAFSGDSRWLISGSWDRSLRVRDLRAVERPVVGLLADLSRRYGLDLTEALGGTVDPPQ